MTEEQRDRPGEIEQFSRGCATSITRPWIRLRAHELGASAHRRIGAGPRTLLTLLNNDNIRTIVVYVNCCMCWYVCGLSKCMCVWVHVFNVTLEDVEDGPRGLVLP